MGDVWPFGKPRYTDWQQCYDALLALGFQKGDANIGAAIAGAESSYDLAVVNDTPSTGDYSVGCWQVNYYGSLYAGRVQQFGTPKHLAQSTVSTQASAAHEIWTEQGWSAWSTYTHGQYKDYLNNKLPAGPSPAHQLQTPDTYIKPPTEDYSGTIRAAAKSQHDQAAGWDRAAVTLRKLRR